MRVAALDPSSSRRSACLRCASREIAEDDKISHEDAYGKVLGTTVLCTLPFIALTLVTRKYVKAVFPPAVSGVILALVGIESFARGLTRQSRAMTLMAGVSPVGYQFWGGGPDCATYPVPCSLNGHVRAPYGSPEFLGAHPSLQRSLHIDAVWSA